MASLVIQSIHCYPFLLPLAQPVTGRGQEHICREGLVVHIISDRGCMGFGEIAPLPGVSSELLKKAVHQAETLARELKNAPVPVDGPHLLEWLTRRFSGGEICPSVKFGFEAALTAMAADTHNLSVAAFLGTDVAQEASSAGFLHGSSTDIVRQARFLSAKGYTTFQLKVGSRNIPLDIQRVESLRQVIGPEGKLRLDAEGGWRLDEAIVFAENTGMDRIEYLQDPVANFLQIEQFTRRTAMPVALGLSGTQRPLEELGGLVGLTHVIACPMLMNGISGHMKLLDTAKDLGLHVIVEGLFESGIGMTALANLASMTPATANLGTANWFDGDLLLRPVLVDAGRIPKDRLHIVTKFFTPSLTGRLKAV